MSEPGFDPRLIQFHRQYGKVSELPTPVIVSGIMDEAGRIIPMVNNRMQANGNGVDMSPAGQQDAKGVYLDLVQVGAGITTQTLAIAIWYESNEAQVPTADQTITLQVGTAQAGRTYNLRIMARRITATLSGAGAGGELYLSGSW